MLCNMPIKTMQKYSRRARGHKRSCLELAKEEDFDLKLVSLKKTKKELKGKMQLVNLIDDEEVVIKAENRYVIDFSKISKEKESNFV